MESSGNKQESFYKEITEADEENKKCFDCGNSDPQWVSINNGILVCMACSGLHRGLGVKTSAVRSISFDFWNDKQMEMVRLGGNKRLREFFDKYDLNQRDLQEKYFTKAAEFYRKRLQALVNNQDLEEEEPSKEEGIVSLKEEKPKITEQLETPSEMQEETLTQEQP